MRNTKQTKNNETDEIIYSFVCFVIFRLFSTLSCSFFALSLLSSSCSHRDPEPERRAAVESTISKIRSCAPENRPDDKLKLAIANVKIEPQHTSVRLVAYAFDQAIDFDLPVYIMSRGRWMINDVGRAYLLDEHCSEYRLRDRRSSSGQAVPLDGRIRLNPGQAFEAILNFQRLPDQTRMGVLVYGNNTLSFMLWDQAQ
jgi:hypothetical protein